MSNQCVGDPRRGAFMTSDIPRAPKVEHAIHQFIRWWAGRIEIIGAALLLSLALLPARPMAAHAARPAIPQASTTQNQPLTAAGTAALRWGQGVLHVSLTATGLTPDTSTQAFLVPGTCSHPGSMATFATPAIGTDANGTIAEARTKIGAQLSGIRLPKAVEVVQSGQIVLCGDTTEDASSKDMSGLVRSAAISVTLTPASGPAPGQVSDNDSAQTGPDPVSLMNKQTLVDTSIDGPALSSVFVPSATSESVLAWTGTDAAHHLNVETSSDGLHFAQKVTLRETSPFRPDVALTRPGGPVAVAWTGTDANHSLNVLYDVYGARTKLTLLRESSFTAPALLLGPGFYLAWTGTDANHSLNIVPLALAEGHLAVGTKTVLPQFSSNAGPHMARHGATTLVLDWTSRALQLRLAFGTDVTILTAASLPQTSAFAPQTQSIGLFAGEGRDWIGWTGADPAHHLNLQWTTAFPQFTDPASTKTILSDTALGGPSLAFNAGDQIAWTGTDSAHHLNIAKYVVS
jgi:hypothetical protein